MSKKEWLFSISMFVLMIFLIGGYRFIYLTVWGFHLNRFKLGDVIVMTKKHSYMITNHEDVMRITKEASKMKRSEKVTQTSLNSSNQQHEKYIKLLIQFKNHTTYGGQIWKDGSDFVIDGAGYYYRMDDNEMKKIIETSLKNARTIN